MGKKQKRIKSVDVPPELSGHDLIDWACNEWDVSHVVGLFSGGHDSLTATHLASRHPRFSFACHINTGIGVEETREFVRETCRDWGIELREYRAEDYIGGDGQPCPQRYTDFVFKYGFPGPGQHHRMYQRLKERPLRNMIRDLDRKRGQKVLLITGVRADESIRRTAHVDQAQIWEGTKVWVAPVWDMTKQDTNAYVKDNNLTRNPVVDAIHMSGECLCGAYAHKGELDELAFWYPETAKEIRIIEDEAARLGMPWRWEDGPPKWHAAKADGQLLLLDEGMLCSTCTVRHNERTTEDE